MHVGILVAVLTTVLASQQTSGQPVAGRWAGTAAALAAMLLVVSFAGGGSWWLGRQLDQGHMDARRAAAGYRRLQRAFVLVWLSMVASVLVGLDWSEVVRDGWGLRGWLLVDDVAIFAPLWLPLLLAWACFFEVERRLQGGEETSEEYPDRREYLNLHIRHYLCLFVLPVWLLLAWYDVVEWLDWTKHPVARWLQAAPLVAVVGAFPWLLQWVTRGKPLPGGELRTRLEKSLSRWRVRVRELLVWHTSGQMLNAAVAGALPGTRLVLLTDALLEEFSEDQIEAVLAHEAAHLRRGHLWQRLLLLALPAAAFWAATRWFPALTAWTDSVAVAAGYCAFVLVALPWYSRRQEYDADLWAWTRLNESPRGNGWALPSALACLEAAYPPQRWAAWLHPTLARRIALLHQAAGDPLLASRWERSTDRLARTVTVLWLITLALGASG